MCGILGLYSAKDAQFKQQHVDMLRDLMIHRGPDDFGTFIDTNIALAHRRLSIIDLAGGHQPMQDIDGRYTIVYNGEIYNFKELREELIRRGYRFQTNSDTETIVNLYADCGEECVKHLNGMFAFAIWDRKKRSLFIARDRMGIKPLYYMKAGNTFIFSSELKVIVRSEYIQPQLNEDKVNEYFLFRYITGEDTLIKNVKNLLPGHTLTIYNDKISIKSYWSLIPSKTEEKVTFNEASENVRILLEKAVERRMLSDVPLGTFCSGGIDSSLVTAIASKYAGDNLNTFSVGFHESEYDETNYAQVVSKLYNTRHHEVKLYNQQFSDLLQDMIWHNDEPLNFPNSVLIYAVSRLARDYVTVVLTGEGSDELFLGYPRYQIPAMIQNIRRYPFVPFLIKSLYKTILKDHRLEKLYYNLNNSEARIILKNSIESVRDNIPFSDQGLDYRYAVLSRIEKFIQDPWSRVQLADQFTYLLSILNRQDKMSMAASIESRVPFLDHELVEYANRLPSHIKARFFKSKNIVKHASARYLPKNIIYRRKSGFGVPLKKWFESDSGLGAQIYTLIDEYDKYKNFIEIDIEKVITQHKNQDRDHSNVLWTLLNFSIWRQKFNL